MANISFRESIRWFKVADSVNEPTHTVVLTGRTGVFVDVRFLKDIPGSVDWAFAGRRIVEHVDESKKTSRVRFIHEIDSREAQNPQDVKDVGIFSDLGDGWTLEQTEEFEEVWRDIEEGTSDSIFLKRLDEEQWYARIGEWELQLGRHGGVFWALQSHNGIIIDSMEYSQAMPRVGSEAWIEGNVVEWEQGKWIVLENKISTCND